MNKSPYTYWNPWHGCTKISDGCKYCYVYRQDEMYGTEINSSVCRKTANFNLPVKKKRDGSYKIPSGEVIFTCFTSDFLLEDADGWRNECWQMIKERSDCMFYFFTKRITRLQQCLPQDWGTGYDNVHIGCTVENQKYADIRLPVFLSLPIKHRSVIVAPMLEQIDISKYLKMPQNFQQNKTNEILQNFADTKNTEKQKALSSFEKSENYEASENFEFFKKLTNNENFITEVSVGGESGVNARPCNYDWVLNLRRQCVENNVSFNFHQTGAYFIKDRKTYRIKRAFQISQAALANINFTANKNTTVLNNPKSENKNKI